jgi:hypothetical protein
MMECAKGAEIEILFEDWRKVKEGFVCSALRRKRTVTVLSSFGIEIMGERSGTSYSRRRVA